MQSELLSAIEDATLINFDLINDELKKRSIPLTLGPLHTEKDFSHFDDGYYVRFWNVHEDSENYQVFAIFNFKRMGFKEVIKVSLNQAGETVIGAPSKQFTALTKAALKEAKELRTEKFRRAKSVCETIYEMQRNQSSRIQPDYLIRKHFATQLPAPAYAVDNSGDNQTLLVVPGFDDKGELWTLQTIFANGAKQFQNSSRVKEVFHILGCDPSNYKTVEPSVPRVLIAEGYTTSLACYLSAEVPTLCCFSAANLKAGAAFAHRKYPNAEIIICADNDAGTFLKIAENPGIKAAIEAAMVTPSRIAYPFADTKNQDFCDFWPDFSGIRAIIAKSEPVSMTKHLFACLFEPRAKLKREKKKTEVRKLKAALDPRTLSPEISQLINETYPVTILEGPEIMKTETPPQTPPEPIDDTPIEVSYFDEQWTKETFSIMTRDTGFHSQIEEKSKGGDVKIRAIPNPQDLRMALYEQDPFITLREAGTVYKYNGVYWELLWKAEILNFAETKYFPPANNNKVNEFFGSVSRWKLAPVDFFNTAKKTNFSNGWFDIEELEFHTHTPEHGFKHVLTYPFDPQALCPEWDKFIYTCLSEDRELVMMAEEFLGYCLSGDKCWGQKALVAKGEGSNGKSVFMQTVRKLIGKENTISSKLDELQKSSYSKARLNGALAVISEETPKESLTESSFFKDIVSGGTIEVREIYGTPYDLENRAKLIFSCNDLPVAVDTTHAFFRRLLILPFDKTFEGESADVNLPEKLEAELSGIYNRCIKAYMRLKNRKRFVMPESSKRVLDEYREDSDHVLRWAREHLVALTFDPSDPDHSTFISTDALYSQFRAWSMAKGHKYILAENTFGKRLKKCLPDGEKRYGRPRVDGKKVFGYFAVRWS